MKANKARVALISIVAVMMVRIDTEAFQSIFDDSYTGNQSSRTCHHDKPCHAGICIHESNKSNTFCLCYQGYQGEFCEIVSHQIDRPLACSSNPCITGQCIDITNESRERAFICYCQKGLENDTNEIRCYQVPCQNPCISNPCRHQGLCQAIDDEQNPTMLSYKCICSQSYLGQDCQFPNPCNSSPCSHGTCIGQTEDRYICLCNDGYTGRNCSIEVLMDGDLRLVGGHDHDEGKIEVYYRGLWAGICDDYFDQRDANVICRQLGYRAVIDYFCCSKFNDTEAYGYTSNQTLFWLDHLECEGHEKNIMECSHEGWGNHDCSSHESSGVRCTNDVCKLIPSCIHGHCILHSNHSAYCNCYPGYTGKACDIVHSCISSPCSANATCHDEIDGEYSCQCPQGYYGPYCEQGLARDQDLRMVYGYNQNAEGLIQVYHEGLWGTICIVDFDINEANVICRQLGFQGALFARESGLSNQIGHGRIWLSKLVCKGVERSIRDCFQKQWTRRHCEHSMDVILRCTDNPCFVRGMCVHGQCVLNNHTFYLCRCNQGYSGIRCDQTNQTDGAIRLVDYSTDRKKRLEIVNQGVWLPLCYSQFNREIARVICHQLGYAKIDSYEACQDSSGFYGGKRYPDLISCSGSELSLNQCMHFPNVLPNCQDLACLQCKELSNPCFSSPCLYGRCSHHQGVNSYHCFCQEGYTGKHCQQYDYCAFANCTFNSTCINFVNGFNCQCQGGYSGINCQNGPTENGQARLISYANNDDRGLVEIYINGSWGTICDDYFTIDVGHVLCRQLGYIGFVEYKCCSTWGSGRGRIWIEKINCSGNENHILDCRIDNNQDQYCNHREDVGIHCTDDPCLAFEEKCSFHGQCQAINQSSYHCICQEGYSGSFCEISVQNTADPSTSTLNYAASSSLGGITASTPYYNRCGQLALPCASSPCSQDINSKCIDIIKPFLSFTCFCLNGYFNGTRCINEITVSHIQIHPNFSMDQSKQVIALECTAYGWPLPALSWWIGKEMITSSYHATLVTSNPKLYQNKLTLIFKSFSSADNNGSYWCKGINSISEARSIKDITLGNCHQSNICLHGKCYQRKGRFYCSCDKNYTGNKCQTFLCDLRVGSKVDYFSCNNSDGKPNCNCSHGTETWFVTPSSKYLLTGIIIGGLIDAMAILILLVIGVILYRRFRRQSVPRYLLDDQDVNELL